MWINEADLIIFKTHSEIRDYFRDTSFPLNLNESIIAMLGLKPVAQISKPNCNYFTETVIEDSPANNNGQWTQVWKIIPASEQETLERKKQVKEEIKKQIQNRLDTFAQSRDYDNILEAASFATSGISEFQKEGQCAVELRDLTWTKFYEIMSDVESGKREMPVSYSKIESELPVLNWK